MKVSIISVGTEILFGQITNTNSVFLSQQLNLLGFDVLYFIPTGYNMEGHLNQKLMEEHQTGEFMYDLQIPDWSTVPLTIHTSWRDKLFRRG